MQTAIPCTLIRGGSSKGLYFLGRDLPSEPELRERILLAAMGGADPRQIDGLGGAHPLTSKIAIVGPSTFPEAHVDYLFAQAIVGEDRIDFSPTCGNILAGVGSFAIEKGLVKIEGDYTRICVHMVNTNKMCDLVICTKDGSVTYEGDAEIDGVPGTSAPIICDFPDAAGASCGSLLPTGKVRNQVNGVEVTCIDAGMPVVLLRASDFGLTGDELPEDLNKNQALKTQLNDIRLKLGPMMNLGDVKDKAIPKMSLVSAPTAGGHISTRTFIPHVCHEAIGVLGAASVAAGCIVAGSVCSDFVSINGDQPITIKVEHPLGYFEVTIEYENNDTMPYIKKIGLLRTARILMDGQVFIPASVWDGCSGVGEKA